MSWDMKKGPILQTDKAKAVPLHTMVAQGQHHTLAALYPGERTPSTHCTGGWVGLRAGLGTGTRGKILCLCWESNGTFS
jgi:hypothetical protein